MKKVLIMLLAVICCQQQILAQGVHFMGGPLKEVLSKAKVEKKLVFIDCYTSWCGPCARMTREIFPQKVCGDYFNDIFVSTKFDMEKGEGAELQKTFKCISYPTFVILNADGKEVARLSGASTTAEDFVGRIKAAVDPSCSSDSLKKKYEANKCMQTGLPYAKALYDKGYNISEILDDIYLHSAEFDRYNSEFLTYFLNCTDFRSSMFDRMMFDKEMWNERLGRENVDRMIFDSYRKTMYLVASGRPNDLSADDVRKAAFLTSLLALPYNNTERYLPSIALYVKTKDWDRLIDVFTRRVLPATDDSYKAILMGILQQYYPQFNDNQKAIVDKALEFHANSLAYGQRTTNDLLQMLKK